jgi:predicted helicase
LVKKDFEGSGKYEMGFKIDELFCLNSSGIKTHRDHFVIDFQKESLSKRINEFYDSSYNDLDIGIKLDLKDNRDWSITEDLNDVDTEIEIYNQSLPEEDSKSYSVSIF